MYAYDFYSYKGKSVLLIDLCFIVKKNTKFSLQLFWPLVECTWMPLVVLRFSLREVDTNASHTEPAEGIKERIVCETGKKGSRKFFPSRY